LGQQGGGGGSSAIIINGSSDGGETGGNAQLMQDGGGDAAAVPSARDKLVAMLQTLGAHYLRGRQLEKVRRALLSARACILLAPAEPGFADRSI